MLFEQLRLSIELYRPTKCKLLAARAGLTPVTFGTTTTADEIGPADTASAMAWLHETGTPPEGAC